MTATWAKAIYRGGGGGGRAGKCLEGTVFSDLI